MALIWDEKLIFFVQDDLLSFLIPELDDLSLDCFSHVYLWDFSFQQHWSMLHLCHCDH